MAVVLILFLASSVGVLRYIIMSELGAWHNGMGFLVRYSFGEEWNVLRITGFGVQKSRSSCGASFSRSST